MDWCQSKVLGRHAQAGFGAVQGKRNLLWRFTSEGVPVEVQQLSQMLPDTVAGELKANDH
jgi:hypothetical protein